MFGLGFAEIVVILVIALLVLGPDKLPGIAKQVGKGLREFRRAASEFQEAMHLSDDFMQREHKERKAPQNSLSQDALSNPEPTQDIDTAIEKLDPKKPDFKAKLEPETPEAIESNVPKKEQELAGD